MAASVKYDFQTAVQPEIVLFIKICRELENKADFTKLETNMEANNTNGRNSALGMCNGCSNRSYVNENAKIKRLKMTMAIANFRWIVQK